MRAAVGLMFADFMILANICPTVWANPHTTPEYTKLLYCTAYIQVTYKINHKPKMKIMSTKHLSGLDYTKRGICKGMLYLSTYYFYYSGCLFSHTYNKYTIKAQLNRHIHNARDCNAMHHRILYIFTDKIHNYMQMNFVK